MFLQVIRSAAVWVVLAGSGALFAQSQTPVRKLDAVVRGVANVTPAQSQKVVLEQRTVQVSNLVGEGAIRSEIRGVPLLVGFRLAFGNGDHKVRRLGIAPEGQVYVATFSDQQPDDPFSSVISYWDAQGETLGSVNFVSKDSYGAPDYLCYGFDPACTFEMPGTVRSDEDLAGMDALHRDAALMPVLSGFVFERQDIDANIMEIGADYGCLRAPCLARLGMTDAAGFDARNLGEGKSLQARNVLVRATYALIPRRLVQTCQTLSGGRRPDAPDPAIRRMAIRDDPRALQDFRAERVPIAFRNAKVVIQGFRFKFLNGDHHLQDIGVEYHPSGAFYLTFGDGTRDDPYSWTLSYCVLR